MLAHSSHTTCLSFFSLACFLTSRSFVNTATFTGSKTAFLNVITLTLFIHDAFLSDFYRRHYLRGWSLTKEREQVFFSSKVSPSFVCKFTAANSPADDASVSLSRWEKERKNKSGAGHQDRVGRCLIKSHSIFCLQIFQVSLPRIVPLMAPWCHS